MTTAYARTADPTTSHEAAESVTGITALQAAVLSVLAERGPMTDEALVAIMDGVLQTTPQGIRSRRSELRDLGAVVAVDREGRTRTGRRATRWGVAQ